VAFKKVAAANSIVRSRGLLYRRGKETGGGEKRMKERKQILHCGLWIRSGEQRQIPTITSTPLGFSEIAERGWGRESSDERKLLYRGKGVSAV